MDVKMISPIAGAFTAILPQIGFASVEETGVAIAPVPLTNKGVLINISVVGPMKGAIVIGMELAAARQFASRMMMGMEVAEFDAMAQSALSEMANMVCANACTNLANAGMEGFDISPPTLLIGQGSTVMLAAPQITVVGFSVDGIAMEVFVGLA